MTGMEIVEQVQTAGGILTLNGDKVRWRIPEKAAGLLGLLSAHRDAVIQVLRQRAGALTHWMNTSCVGCIGASANPKILHREYRAWAGIGAFTYEEFLGALEIMGFQLDGHRMIVGLCLAQDWLAAWHQEHKSRLI